MYLCLGRMTPEKPQYDAINVIKDVTLGTDLYTLLTEIDHWPVRRQIRARTPENPKPR